MGIERLPGFRDFYPEPLPSQEAWSRDASLYLFRTWRETARRFGFREYDGPPLESTNLYTLKSGEEILEQLYHFVDKGEREVALRPEMTPTLARLIAAHERNYKKPIKWFAIPQLFRYERQQKGRLREHYQFNADILGEADPAADAEILALLINTLRALGLTEKDFMVRLSSRQAWHEYYARHHGPEDQAYAFYQVIDKLGREPNSDSDEKLRALGFNLDAVRGWMAEARPTPDLERILDALQAQGLGDFVRVDYGVIRGLAYYTGPVFEAFDRRGEFRAIAGGGRYDHLLELISGGRVRMPALGFGMGDVVLLELLKARKLLPEFAGRLDAFFLIEEESLRRESLRLIQQLREAGLSVDYPLTRTKPDKQFKRALECNAGMVVRAVIRPGEPARVSVKDLKSREEVVCPLEEAVTRIKEAL